MGTHRFPGCLLVASLDRREDALVMELSALRSSSYVENPAALLAKKTDNRIQEGENKRISDCFRERQMKIQICFYKGVGVAEAAIHRRNSFSHCGQELFVYPGGGQAGDLG